MDVRWFFHSSQLAFYTGWVVFTRVVNLTDQRLLDNNMFQGRV